MNCRLIKTAIAFAVGLASFAASAAPILLVSRQGTDVSISAALSNAGHSVTTVIGASNGSGQRTLTLPSVLTPYAAVYMSATMSYSDQNLTTSLASLASYVNAGGRVFVTGYDSVFNTAMQNFLTGSNSGVSVVDTCGVPQAIANVANSLTTGAVDIRGMTPGTSGNQTCDRDGLMLAGDTVGVVASGGNPGFYQWTLRNLGLGQIAYVSNGNYSGDSTMWTENTAYRGALLNFAANASAIPEPGTLAMFGLGFAGLGALRRRKAK